LARTMGFSPETPQREVLGPGAIYVNCPDFTPENVKKGIPYGATRGGNTFVYEPDYTNREYDGVPAGLLKGSRRQIVGEARIESTGVEVIADNVRNMLPGLSKSDWMSAGGVATLTIGATNAAVRYDAYLAGAAGNAVRVAHVNPGVANASLSVAVSGNDVTVTLANGATAGTITSTAAQVRDAVNANAAARALLTASLPGDGSAVAVAQAITNLAGGGTGSARIGTTLTPKGFIENSDYLRNVVLVGEREGSAIGFVAVLFDALSDNELSIELPDDEGSAAVDVTWKGHLGVQSYNASTGVWTPPFRLNLLDPVLAS
jgi:hypothetical protein